MHHLKGSILYNEVEFLMRQQLRETATYYIIIEAIALGNTKLNDIYTKTLIDKTKINVYLKNLIDLNIIEKEYPVTESLKKIANIQSGLYKIKEKSTHIKGNYDKKYYYLFSKNGFEDDLIDISKIDETVILVDINEICG